MRLPSTNPNCLFSTLTILPAFALAVNLGIEHIVVDGAKFDLSPLKGPISVSSLREHPPIVINTTYTLDIYRPLKRTKGVPKEEECPSGTHVCAIEYRGDEISGVIPIAGNYETSSGGSLDPHWTRLKTSSSHADSQLEGLRLEIGGASYGTPKRKQQAVIEFICQREGETEKRDEDEEDGDDDEDNKAGQQVDDGKGGTLKFFSYGPPKTDGTEDVLRLQWDTPYACEDAEPEKDQKPSSHWGFFTWMFVIVFLAIAAYIIFGSWLNYTRYGARGWDLLPHGDTIRDVPYIMQDWSRKVVDTVQGRGGSRGGYSAV